MERCPVCRARLSETRLCGRCKTDLAQVLAIETEARRLLHVAVGQLVGGQSVEADSLLQQSLWLKREPLALVLRDFLSRRAQSPAPHCSDIGDVEPKRKE